MEVLRGVQGLQNDLGRVRQQAVSLGVDLEKVRRERDGGDEVQRLKDEAVRLRRKLAVFEVKVADHVCPS